MVLSQTTSTCDQQQQQEKEQQQLQQQQHVELKHMLAGTVLDGELIWLGSGPGRQGFFLAFDALSVGGQSVWSMPLAQRTATMVEGLHLVEAEQCEPLQVAAAAAAAQAIHTPSVIPGSSSGSSSISSTTTTTKPLCTKKQQAAPIGSDSIMLVYKQHLSVAAATLQQLESTRHRCPYPTDGLVFTPNSMLYALGMQELLFKWQPAEQVPFNWD